MQERAVRTLERGDELQAGGVDSFSNAGPCAPENHHGGASLEPPEKKRKPKHAPQENGFGFRLGAPQASQGQSVNYAADSRDFPLFRCRKRNTARHCAIPLLYAAPKRA